MFILTENQSCDKSLSSSTPQLKGWVPTAREFERFLEEEADPYEAAILRHFNRRSHGFTRPLRPESLNGMARALRLSKSTIIRRLKGMRVKGWITWEPCLSQRVLPPRLRGRRKGVYSLTGCYHEINTYVVLLPFVFCNIHGGVVSGRHQGGVCEKLDTTCRAVLSRKQQQGPPPAARSNAAAAESDSVKGGSKGKPQPEVRRQEVAATAQAVAIAQAAEAREAPPPPYPPPPAADERRIRAALAAATPRAKGAPGRNLIAAVIRAAQAEGAALEYMERFIAESGSERFRSFGIWQECLLPQFGEWYRSQAALAAAEAEREQERGRYKAPAAECRACRGTGWVVMPAQDSESDDPRLAATRSYRCHCCYAREDEAQAQRGKIEAAKALRECPAPPKVESIAAHQSEALRRLAKTIQPVQRRVMVARAAELVEHLIAGVKRVECPRAAAGD